jgi:hypothetical protein
MNECYGITIEEIACLCKVDLRTARRWKSGESRMPETARMILAGDLGCFDPAWRGWMLRDGKLISPEGREATAGDVLSIPLNAGADQCLSGEGAHGAGHGRAATAWQRASGCCVIHDEAADPPPV